MTFIHTPLPQRTWPPTASSSSSSSSSRPLPLLPALLLLLLLPGPRSSHVSTSSSNTAGCSTSHLCRSASGKRSSRHLRQQVDKQQTAGGLHDGCGRLDTQPTPEVPPVSCEAGL
jgi:hypothetical protein